MRGGIRVTRALEANAAEATGGIMSIFRRQPKSLLPPNIVPLMERFGRHEINPMNSPEDGYAVFQATQQPLIDAARDTPTEFVDALAHACLPVGGWAVYGADRTVVNLIGMDLTTEAWYQILDASNTFLRENFVPPMRVPAYAWSRFIEQGGSGNTWLTLRPAPNRDDAVLTPLRPGESRHLVTMDERPESNRIFATLVGDRYAAVVDSPRSDDDPTRCQFDWKQADDQYELYLDVAWSTQQWHWADPELEPFFPAPPALI
jgi:hypothetical protein